MITSVKEENRNAGSGLLSVFKGATGPLIGLIILCIFLSFATDRFMSARNLLNILDQITVLGIMAVGMTMVILIGGIDLAVGSVMALTMMVMGYLANQIGLPLGMGILLALAVAGVTGAIAGLLITVLGVPAFIATLAMMSVARGLANMITDGQQIVGFPPWFSLLSYTRFGGFLTLTVAIMLIVFVLGWLYLRYTSGGRSLYAIGGNQEVARLAGINVNLYTVGVYVVSGLLAGLAGVVLAMRLDSVQPTAGVSYELDTIAAVVIGGTSLSGGKGGILGTIIGVLIIGVLRNGLNLLGVSPFTQAVVIGVVIALAVAAEGFKRK
ncbi:ABC transporter permease [Pararhizobium antarcticum]|uniref:Sugar ABC transporter permease n=1 Tax=Pararhizobium antarcticum TaxID=1798805 RepID=A0A657LQR6_9HYPH|nr:ABC transporter permease [Pararhizobium antarcticum]OJF95577.1 sugar ABC transporter permease [Pararhizobium antarcticum]OJF99654.1 sugar ABC transporter permease [Rhizobium sp. 58]